MLSTLRINPRLKTDNTLTRVLYTLDPYDKAEGPLRAMQKFTVILMTTQGSDTFRPWFGTRIPKLTLMNIVDTTEAKILVRDEVNSAISQFFRLQSDEQSQNDVTRDDIISNIELVSIDITNNNSISVKIKFTPLSYESLIYSLEL